MFPGVLMLDIDQISSLMRYGRGHLYNLSHEGKLPFRVSRGVGNKILVSIVEMAAYLDKTMLSEYEPLPVLEPELVVRKRGRPRGSATRVSSPALGFHGELRSAIVRFRTKELFTNVRTEIQDLKLSTDASVGCDEKFAKAQIRLLSVADGTGLLLDDMCAKLSNADAPDLSYSAREIPFFVTNSSLIANLCVEIGDTETLSISDLQVHWFTWARAMSMVWVDEENRLKWLDKMTSVIPDLALAADEFRRQTLMKV